jgi:hypothetical protein
MVLAGVTSYKKARAKMSYETWWLVKMGPNGLGSQNLLATRSLR